jgi:anaerobic dimethyl sulfoxide reductase subunit C (anchor subunit)
MNTRDWALVAFTILSQMSVGSFVVLGVVHFFAQRKSGIEEADKLSDRALLAIGPALILGMLASLLHLGNPLNAPRAVSNLGSSWLSAEVSLGVVFAIVGGVFALMQWRKVGTPALRNAVAVIAALVGLVLVFAMSRVYMLPTIPAWNTLATPVTFYVTTFLLGALAMGTAFVVNYMLMHRTDPESHNTQLVLLRDSLRWIALASIFLLGAEFVVLPLYLAYLASGSAAAAASAAILTNQNGAVLAVRLLLAFLGAGVFTAFIYQNTTSQGKVRVAAYLAYAAFALVLLAEILGRYLFYASFVRIGI